MSAIRNELACEAQQGIRRNEVLIADITPDSTGELYFYVNDAVRFWDSREHHKFYKDNSGKAKVTVTRTVAPATIDFNSADGGQPQQRN
jgi:adenylate cyclase